MPSLKSQFITSQWSVLHLKLGLSQVSRHNYLTSTTLPIIVEFNHSLLHISDHQSIHFNSQHHCHTEHIISQGPYYIARSCCSHRNALLHIFTSSGRKSGFKKLLRVVSHFPFAKFHVSFMGRFLKLLYKDVIVNGQQILVYDGI